MDQVNTMQVPHIDVSTAPRDIKRKSYLDFLRILACFLVIFNHVPGYDLFRSKNGAVQWVYMFITMFTRINVPIFFMISGALLLPREEPLSKVLKQRTARIFAVILVFSTVLYIAYNPWGATFGGWLRGIITGDVNFAYWYLYAYLGFLVMLPFMREIAKNFGRKEFIYLLVLHVCFGTVWKMFEIFLSWRSVVPMQLSVDFSIPLVQTKAFFYPLMGYYLDCVFKAENLKKRNAVLLIAAAVLGILVTSGITYADGLLMGEFTEAHADLFVWLTAMAVFVVTKYLFTKKQMSAFAVKVLAFAGSLTFGIYLLDPLLQHWILWPLIQSVQAPMIVTSLAWCVFSMALGGGITYLLKKMPGLL